MAAPKTKHSEHPPAQDFGEFHNHAAEFAQQQFSLLRTEVLAVITAVRSLERDVVIVVGVIWGFLALHPPATGETLSWWAPVLFTVLGAIRAWTFHRTLEKFGSYLRRIEDAFATQNGPEGWENYWVNHRPPLPMRALHVGLFWGVLFCATVAVAVYKR